MIVYRLYNAYYNVHSKLLKEILNHVVKFYKNVLIHTHTPKNAGLFQPNVGSNMD